MVWLGLYHCCSLFYWACVLLWVFGLAGNLCWACVCVVQVRTVADTDSLAQASLPRSGEMCRGSSRVFCASGRPGDQSVFWASKQLAQARGVSLNRDPVLFPILFSSPRLGEGGARLSEHVSLERNPSAWARCWARQCCVEMFVYFWMICFGWVWMLWCGTGI